MNLEKWALLLAGSERDGVDCHSYSAEKGNGNSCEVETSIFLYALVRRWQPTTIVDTGTNFGVSSAVMALGLEDNWKDYQHKPRGMVHTIDCTDYPENERLWTRLGLRDFIRKIVGDSRQVPPPPHLQMLFVDADHAEEFVLEEWDHFAPAFHPKQVVILAHDTRLDEREGRALHRIVTERREPIPRYHHFAHLPLRNMRGLDLLWLSNESY